MTRRESEMIEVRSVSMYPSDWQIVDTFAAEHQINTSAAVRLIVQERDMMQEVSGATYGVAVPAGNDG